MTPRDFCYWLQGFFEINDPIMIDPNEMDVIKDHLKLVFQKETPDRSISGPFLGIQKEVFDEKYIKEALGLEKAKGLKRVPIEDIPYIQSDDKYGSFTLSSDKLPDLSHLLQYDGVPISC